MIKCRFCERKFETLEALNAHMWAKHKERKLPPLAPSRQETDEGAPV